MQQKWSKILALFLVFSSCFVGCGDDSLFKDAPGHFEGFFTAFSGGKSKHYLVSADIVGEDKRTLRLDAKTADQKQQWSFRVRAETSDRLMFTELEGAQFQIRLKKSSDECFASKLGEVRLCFDGKEINIDVEESFNQKKFTVSLSKFDPSKMRPLYESPARYTLVQLINRAVVQNFDSRIEFEKVVQAKLNAKVAAYSLLPHVSSNTMITYALFGSLGPLAIIGDLAPFLFPTRWIRSKVSSLQADAEFDTMILMKADAANIAEGLVYSIERDIKARERMVANIAEIVKIRDEVRVREKLGLVNPGSSDELTVTVNTLQRGHSGLARLLKQEYSSLAQTVGFFNPEAILGIEPVGTGNLENFEEINLDATTDLAMQRSYELHQIDVLLEAAKWDKTSRYFAWIDPTGNPDGALGLGLPSYIEIGASLIRELFIKREKIQSILIQKLYDTVTEIKMNHEGFVLAKENFGIQEKKLKRILDTMRLGGNFSSSEMVAVIQERTRSEVEVLNAEYSYYAALSKLNRLLFIGPYADLNPEKGREAIAGSAAIVAPKAYK